MVDCEQKLSQLSSSCQSYILKFLLISALGKVRAVVNKEMAGPQEHAKKYDKYSDLITKKADADVERFLLEGHDFDRFAVVCYCIASSCVL